MAQLTSDVTYEQLKRIGDWHLTEEVQRSALAELVSAIADLDTSSRWGEGRTAASDGQRFSLPRRVLQQTYSTRFSDFALEFYTFVADNYAPFYSLPIECTSLLEHVSPIEWDNVVLYGQYILDRKRVRRRRRSMTAPLAYKIT
jgi:TnpA family transposase